MFGWLAYVLQELVIELTYVNNWAALHYVLEGFTNIWMYFPNTKIIFEAYEWKDTSAAEE